jgi:hypothetical protein
VRPIKHRRRRPIRRSPARNPIGRTSAYPDHYRWQHKARQTAPAGSGLRTPLDMWMVSPSYLYGSGGTCLLQRPSTETGTVGPSRAGPPV